MKSRVLFQDPLFKKIDYVGRSQKRLKNLLKLTTFFRSCKSLNRRKAVAVKHMHFQLCFWMKPKEAEQAYFAVRQLGEGWGKTAHFPFNP